MSKLKDMADNPEKTFGTVKSYTNGAREATKNLKAVLTILESNPKIQEIANTTITAWFKGWDGPGDTNVAVVSGTNMSIRMFLGNVLNDSQLVAQLISVTPEKAPESKESEEVRQRTRFGTFLLALETRYPSSDYKLVFRQAHEALWKWDIVTAKELIRKPLKDDWKIDVHSITDAQWHINALRAIGATDEAALRTKEQVKGKLDKWGQLSSKESALIADISKNLEAEKSRKKAQAEAKYKSVLDALPAHDPLRIQVDRNKDVMIAQFSEDMAYITIMDAFIKKNGSEWLKELGEVYDDMRGLYGRLNFTDENAKMTKEGAIMLASFALTGGAWVLIRSLAAAGRALAGADALKAVDVASKAGTIRQNMTRAWNAGRATLSGVGKATVKGAEWLQNIGKIASSTRLWAIPVEAFKFTSADLFSRWIAWRNEWDRPLFEWTVEKFAKNMVMFGAFAGMEKYVSGPLKEKLFWALTQRGIALNPASTLAVGTTVLTGGDVAAMWGLGMAEKGEFHMPEWKEVFQALAFRIGMKWAEKAFPKIAESIQAQVDKRRSSQKKWSAPEVAKIEKPQKLSDDELLAQWLKNEIAAAKRKDINITPEALAFKEAQLAQLEAKLLFKHNSKIEALKTGEQVRFETQNSQFTFERVNDGYKLINTSNPEFKNNIGEIFSDINILWSKLLLRKGEKIIETIKLKWEPTYLEGPSSVPNVDAKQKLWLTQTKEFNHANLNERADFRKTLDTATRGDSVQIGESIYRRVNNGWQKFDAGTPLAQRDYTQWTFRTTEQVMADWNLAKKPATFKKAEAQPQPEATRSQEQVQYLSDFSSLQLGQKVRVEYQGNIVEGTVARISPNKDSIWIQIGENTRLDGPVGRVKILQDAPLQTAVWKTEGSWVDAKQKLWLTQTKEFNHANLNERADFRKTLDTATRGDSVQIGESIYRRVNNGWQKFDAGTPLAQRDYTQWTFRTTEQVMADWNLAKKPATFKKAEAQPQPEATRSQEYDANGRPIDRGAQDRINQEHRIGGAVPSARQSAEAFANGSFRAEMDIIMTIDDATFQNRFTEAQYRKSRWEKPLRQHEGEMYEAAANVRKHSDATIVANAENIIQWNREFLGSQHPNRGPSNLAQSEKAYIVAENAALRSRLKDIIGKTDPKLLTLVEDAVRTGNPAPLAAGLREEMNKPSNLRRWWPLLLLPLLALCSGDKKPVIPPGLEGGGWGWWRPTLPDEIAQSCADCATGKKGTIDFKRPSEVNPKVILTNEKREKLSEKFMKESVWQDFIKQYDSLKKWLKWSSHPLSQMLMKRIKDVMSVPNVDNVQNLQRCIAMFDPKTPGWNDLDHQKGQDGILGPITTGKILDAISKCGIAKK